jgi:hypothetical protein
VKRPLTEPQAITKALDLQARLSTLVLDARMLLREPNLPAPIKAVVESFSNYCDDTLADCDISSAVDRWDEDEPARIAGQIAGQIAYERETARAAE